MLPSVAFRQNEPPDVFLCASHPSGYAQGIPGHCEGRGVGIVDTANLVELVDAVGLLQSSEPWTEEDQRGRKERDEERERERRDEERERERQRQRQRGREVGRKKERGSLRAIVSNLTAMASNLEAIASDLTAMACNLIEREREKNEEPRQVGVGFFFEGSCAVVIQCGSFFSCGSIFNRAVTMEGFAKMMAKMRHSPLC